MSRAYNDAREELEQAVQSVFAAVDRLGPALRRYPGLIQDGDVECLQEASAMLSTKVKELATFNHRLEREMINNDPI